jgi:HEAT repeat protein
MPYLSRLSAVSVSLAALAVLAPAHAQPRPPAGSSAAARPLTLREATQRLQSADPDEIIEGIDALTRIGTADAVPPLVALVQGGLPDALLDMAVTKLGILGRPEAIEELGVLLRHRRVAVRIRAVTSLSQIRDPRNRPLIESGLRDSDAGVRAEAARALGRINARGSLALLQRAFERNIPEAAESIGALGDAPSADRLLESVGHAPLSVLLPGFRRFLDRRDLPDAVKLRIVEQLVARSPTTQVKAFLQEWVRELPLADRSRARARAELAIRQINDAPGAP